MENTQRVDEELEELKRLIRRFYTYKNILTSIRMDIPTSMAVNRLREVFDLNISEVFRLSVWIMALLFDPQTTLKQILTDEAINKLKEGNDVSVIDALKPLGKLLEERIERYLRTPSV
jgi:hypothetical protein